MNNFTIRLAVDQDIPFLREMLYESIHTPEGQEPPSRDILSHPSMSKYIDDWGRDGDLGLIAMNEAGEPIGSVTYRFFEEANKGYGFVDEHTPELGMAILPEYRGHGIGTTLLKAIIEEARKKGLKAISLSVDPSNPAVRLYQRFGFNEVGLEGTSITMKVDL